MRFFTRVFVVTVTVSLLAFGSAIAAGAGLRLHVLGLRPDGHFGHNQVYDGLGCKWRNLSPAVRISGAPTRTKSLAITIFDPDVPNQSGRWQRLVYDLPAQTTHLAQGAGATGDARLPAGARQGPNDYGAHSYGGPCPPAGTPAHRYRVILWALKVRTLGGPTDASAALISLLIERDAIAHRTVVVPYGR
jgi:Raf kinase inhibitor-like YbhB/YbcL family protein